mgnify:CR=1 FL=1
MYSPSLFKKGIRVSAGTEIHEAFGVDDSDLFTAGGDDAGPAKFGQIPSHID